MAYAAWADLVQVVGRLARLEQLTGETNASHPNTDADLATAVGEMESYLTKAGYTVPLDEPLPAALKGHLVRLWLSFAVKGDQRPPWLNDDAKTARTFLEKVSLGQFDIVDVNTATVGGSNTAPLFYAVPETGFDADEVEDRMPDL